VNSLRNVLITGASRGLGLEIAAGLVAFSRVTNISRSKCPLTRVSSIQCDVSDVTALADALVEKIPGGHQPDTLIINAGVLGSVGLMSDFNHEVFEKAWKVNVESTAALLRYAASMKSVALVLVVSSGAALKGYPYLAQYCATKAAQLSLVRVAAEEDSKTKYLAINPGPLDTEMNRILAGISDARYPVLRKFSDATLRSSARVRAEQIVQVVRFNAHYSSGEFVQLH